MMRPITLQPMALCLAALRPKGDYQRPKIGMWSHLEKKQPVKPPVNAGMIVSVSVLTIQ